MASIENLIVSWNFDNLTSSNAATTFQVSDVSNNYAGSGIDFNGLNVLKNNIKTFNKVHPESLESIDTIQILDEDDTKISDLHKPSNLQLSVENSMYQIISDEMLNTFLDISDYIFKFSRPEFKYDSSYHELDVSRDQFFSKILEKPNIEKYLEFYKWIDSSLGYLINQLLPESTNNTNGLKNTIESHVLERNKYKHQLPLSIQPNRIYSSKSINAIKSLKNSNSELILEDIISGTANTENILKYNFNNNYEVIQTAGKTLNNRGIKQNKTVFKTVFSSVDTLSEEFRDESGENSIYNSLLNKAINKRSTFNVSESKPGINSQGTGSDFFDNNFIQRNVPYTASNYTNYINYNRIPNEYILSRRYGNLLIDKIGSQYETSADLIEPPIQFNIPLKQNLSVKNAFETIDIYSPYSNYLNIFNNRSLYHLNNVLLSSLSKELETPLVENTFYNKSIINSSSFDFNILERTEVVYPRNDKIGLAEVRYRVGYEEGEGYPNENYISNQNLGIFDYNYIYPWITVTYNESYNNNSTIIRSFWRNGLEDRKRTNGNSAPLRPDYTRYNGSINCLGYPNINGEYINLNNITHNNNIYNSIWSLDSKVNISINNSVTSFPNVSYTNEIHGDLAPYSHINLFYLSNDISSTYYTKIFIPPKPSFIFNNYISSSKHTLRYFNLSYQDGIDCRIKPWYDNYDKFAENIKHRSQTYSIVPEFIVSNYRQIIENQYYSFIVPDLQQVNNTFSPIKRRNYLTIKGNEKEEQHNQETFKVDLKNFVDKKSNKIKIKIKAVKKLLPYNGFYPQQRTAQIAGIFGEDYLRSTGYINFDNITHNSTNQNYRNIVRGLTITQPLFAPGILFNTIKAGVAMPWPVQVFSANSILDDSGSIKAFENNIYTHVSYSLAPETVSLQNSVRNLTDKLPFETILDPLLFFKKLENYQPIQNIVPGTDYEGGELGIPGYTLIPGFEFDPMQPNDWLTPINIDNSYKYLTYLDPTNSSKEIINYNNNFILDNITYVKKIRISTLLDYLKKSKNILYKSSINNFLAETSNFFLDKQKVTYFKSTIGDTVSVQSGSIYTMDIVLKRSEDFSQFNKYDSEFGIAIPHESLYGPPVQYTSSNNIDNNHSAIYSYLPYAPPYSWKGESRATLSYKSNIDGEVKISDIVKGAKLSLQTGSINNPSVYWRTNLSDSINLAMVDSGSWYIQTKFETPLINFSGCSKVISGSATDAYVPPSFE